MTPEARQADRERPLADTRLYRAGRRLFGGVLAYMAIDNLRNLEERIGYAEHKGAPRPNVTVPGISVSLLLGSVGVALWRLPTAAAAAIATFFASVTPVMHDFWSKDDPQERQSETIHFLKNLALLGASLAFVAVGQSETRRRRESDRRTE